MKSEPFGYETDGSAGLNPKNTNVFQNEESNVRRR